MNKTTLREKIGYSIASMGDSVGYSLTGTFLLFFLTTIAGISPSVAGTVIAIGAVWNAVANPLIGYFADKVQTRFGRRRPLICIFSVPLMLTMFLLFTNIEMPMSIKPVYYGALLILYWTSYTGFVVPYLALGVDYTSDYDDRTVLRLLSSLLNMFGSMIAMVMPTMIVELLEGIGFSTGQAWSFTGLLLGVVTLVANMITVVASKHKDVCEGFGKEADAKSAALHNDGENAENTDYADSSNSAPGKEKRSFAAAVKEIVSEYITVATLKPMKPLIIASLSALIGYTMIVSDLVYYLTYNIGMSAVAISVVMLAKTVLGAAFIPFVGKMVAVTDRRETLMGAYVVGCVGLIAVKFISFPDMISLVIYIFFATMCTSLYWQVMPSIFYDVCEYDRIKHGKNRAATIVSFQGLVEALAAGAGGQILGWILEAAKFDGEAATQCISAQLAIENSTTIFPIIFFAITIIALYKYPLNKKVYNELLASEKK